jgi:hypothetical protein
MRYPTCQEWGRGGGNQWWNPRDSMTYRQCKKSYDAPKMATSGKAEAPTLAVASVFISSCGGRKGASVKTIDISG